MKLNGNNIITDDDIQVTSLNNTLASVLSNQSTDISKLKSNVKWLYQYGGVGGNGSGSGGSTTTAFGLYTTLNNVLFTTGGTIVLSTTGNYVLHIKVTKPNGGTFNVKYTYSYINSSGNTITLNNGSNGLALTIDNSYELSATLMLNNNAILTVELTDGDTVLLNSTTYITSPYSFDLSVVNDEGALLSTEIFVSDALSEGLNLALTYNVAITATVKYYFTFNGATTDTYDITDDTTNPKLYIIPKALFTDANAGYYTGTCVILISGIENLDDVTITKSIGINLIPLLLYLQVAPTEGTIYTSQLASNYYTYTNRTLYVDTRVFYGANKNRIFSLSYSVDGTIIKSDYNVTERVTALFPVTIDDSGWHTVTFTITYSDTVLKSTYYFYSEVTSTNFDYYPDNGKTYVKNFYKLSNKDNNILTSYTGIIELTVNSSTITGTIPNKYTNASKNYFNTNIYLGLQYKEINDTNDAILELKDEDNVVLLLYLNKIVLNSQSITIYLPKEDNYNLSIPSNFHLINIQSKYIKSYNNNDYYEVSIFIDGLLDGVQSTLSTVVLEATSFIINPVNCFINLFEVLYSDSLTNNKVVINDFDHYQYYVKYKVDTDIGATSNEISYVVDYKDSFEVDLQGHVTTSSGVILNISKTLSVPTLQLTLTLTDSTGDILKYLETSYADNSTTGKNKFNVSVQYNNGTGGDLKDISIPENTGGALFMLLLQGSSTMSYRGKNFTLSLENTVESDELLLFSPNFTKSDTLSYLPEESFTLKADVVDSSHSNNTSVGSFVNDVTTKFNTNDTSSKYSSFTKNCLEGFPCVVFICINSTDANGLSDSNYYYFGMYNFNLGRSSYYNLGYKNLTNLDNINIQESSATNFAFAKIQVADNNFKNGLVVAEISGGNTYYDFSQWDTSILYALNDNDTGGMWGDLVYGSTATYQGDLQTMTRYISLAGGYLFDYLKKGRNAYSLGYTNVLSDGTSANTVPDYRTLWLRYKDTNGTDAYKEVSVTSGVGVDSSNPGKIVGSENILRQTLLDDTENGTTARIDYDSISEYYTICMAFGLTDSVQKNLNMKTWTGNTAYPKWYAAFYDMDTSLGKNNAGDDSDYKAFSDYWFLNSTTNDDGSITPSTVTVMRDFLPSDFSGYDIPSSYLFAIAKYARMILPDEETILNFPLQLWAKWRSSVVNTATHQGCLYNAANFIDNYFSANTANIPTMLLDLDYRYKYLWIENDASILFNNDNYKKFKGCGKYKVHDWLQGRFRILDAYFGINNNVKSIIQYRDSNNNWANLQLSGVDIYEPTFTDNNYLLANNEDIVILKDIFNLSIQLSTPIKFTIKAEENSPLIIDKASVYSRYLVGGDEEYNISVTPNGVLTLIFYGSSAWTYLSNINSLSLTSGLTLNSDNLTTLNGSSGNVAGFTLNMPSLKTLSLNSSGYTGTLTLDSSYGNLGYVSIANSCLNLNFDGLACSTLNLSGVNSTSIIIKNCNNINYSNFSMSNIKCTTVNIAPIPVTSTFSLSGTNISNLTLYAKEANSTTLVIDNDLSLTTLSVSNFKSILVTNCPKLKNVLITDSTNHILQSVNISSCGNTDNTFTIGSTEGTVDLSNCTNLQYLYMPNIKAKFTAAILPSNVLLQTSCFYADYNLTTIDGTNIKISGYNVFCLTNYAMRLADGSYTGLVLNTTDLYNTFNLAGAITLDDAKWFLTNVIPVNSSVWRTYLMFLYCNDIVYNLDMLKSDLAGTTSYCIDLSHLPNVTDASGMFDNCSITAWNKNIFKGFGSSNGVNILGMLQCHSDTAIRTTIDVFENIIDRVTKIFGYTGNWCNPYIYVYDSSTWSTYSTLPLKDLFNPGGVAPSKLLFIEVIDFYSGHTLDFEDTFTASWINFHILNNFCRTKTCKAINCDKLLYNLPAFYYMFNSFRISCDTTIDLFTVLNWDTVRNNPMLVGSNERDAGCFSLPTYISLADFNTLINKLMANSTIWGLECIFLNCTLLQTDNTISLGSTYNTNITTVCNLFRDFNVKASLTGVSIPIKLSSSFFKNLPNCTIYERCFEHCYMYESPGFDFFSKRSESKLSDNVYIKNSDNTYSAATVYQYSYLNNISNLFAMFYESTWYEGWFHLSELTTLPINRIEVNGSAVSTMSYYIKTVNTTTNNDGNVINTDVYTKLTDIKESTEWTDCLNLNGNYSSGLNVGGYNYLNFPVNNEAINTTFIAPDFLYACTSGAEIRSLFVGGSYVNTLMGLMPKNFLKACKSTSLSNTFDNITIIPAFYSTRTSGTNIINSYYFVPDNFTTNGSLASAFRFNMIIPAYPITNSDNTTTYDEYNVFSTTSIPTSTGSLSNAVFNNTLYKSVVATDWPAIGATLIAHINIMRDKTSYNDGIDMTIFSSLNTENLILREFANVYYGNVFNSDFAFNNGHHSTKEYCIDFTVDYNVYYAGPYLILPKITATISNSYLIPVGAYSILDSTKVNDYSSSLTYYNSSNISFNLRS